MGFDQTVAALHFQLREHPLDDIRGRTLKITPAVRERILMLVAANRDIASSGLSTRAERDASRQTVNEIRHQAGEDERLMVIVDRPSRSRASNIFPERSCPSVYVRCQVTMILQLTEETGRGRMR
jgi:hypothetical protein